MNDDDRNTKECVILTDEELDELIEKNGERYEADKLIEEMSELIRGLMKIRAPGTCMDQITSNVCEEFVHVNISLAVLRRIIARQDAKLSVPGYAYCIQAEAEEKAEMIKVNFLGRSPIRGDANYQGNTHR